MDCYIVRIYRRDEDEPGNFIGVVEAVGLAEQKPFKDAKELVTILSAAEAHKTKKPARREPGTINDDL